MAKLFKKVKNVTLPLLKLENNTPYYLKLTGEMHVGKQIDDKKEPATLVNCINLESGEEVQIIVAAVLKGILTEAYPGGDYVGKCFEIVKHRDTEKKYNTFTVAEVAEPEEDDLPTDAGKGGKKK